MFSLLLSLSVSITLSLVVRGSFDPTKHAGGESPWFPAPEQYGISAEIPNGCIVDQAAYITRHGSRYPETGSFQGWVDLHSKLHNTSFSVEGPLAFLPSWELPLDDPLNQATFLSVTGAGEAFTLGVELRKRYGFTKGGENFTVWSASQKRVVDTASFWLKGYLSSGDYDESILQRIVSLPDSVNFTFANSLTPSAACPNYVNNVTFGSNFRAAFRPAITTRINKFLKGIELTDSDIGVMMDLCPYQTEISGSSPFCNIFTEDEWGQFEYSQDLQYYYGSGPGNPLAAATTFPLIKAITELFVLGPGKTTPTGTFIPPPLLMGFTHDNDIPPILAVLGLFNESSYAPLNVKHPNPLRKFRSSYIIPFRGTVALERLSCFPNNSDHQVAFTDVAANSVVGNAQFVRVKVNDAPVPVPSCTSGPGFSCPLTSFSKYVETRGKLAGDFVQRCGLTHISNATSTCDFFTNPP